MTDATAVDRAKLLPNDDGEPVVFHTLRHTFASHYVMRGGRLEDPRQPPYDGGLSPPGAIICAGREPSVTSEPVTPVV